MIRPDRSQTEPDRLDQESNPFAGVLECLETGDDVIPVVCCHGNESDDGLCVGAVGCRWPCGRSNHRWNDDAVLGKLSDECVCILVVGE